MGMPASMKPRVKWVAAVIAASKTAAGCLAVTALAAACAGHPQETLDLS
jgi:hypothetical protein